MPSTDRYVTYVADIPRLTVGLRKKIVDGKPYAPRPQRFNEEGMLIVDLESMQGKEIVDLLDNDDRYGDEYRRVEDAEKALIADLQRTGIATAPDGGIGEAVLGDLEYLEKKIEKPTFVPAETKKITEVILSLMLVFSVHGVRRPEEEDSQRRIKACMLELLDVLEKCEIYPVKE